MSKEVKRYVPEYCESGGEIWAEMQEDSEGGWVRAADYEALLAERDRLREALEGITAASWSGSETATDFAISQSKSFLISKMKELARAALQGAQP